MIRLQVIVAAAVLEALSGLAFALIPRSRRRAQVAAALVVALAGAGGFAASLVSLASGGSALLDRAWLLPWGSFSLGLDPLGAFFLCLVFAIPALGAIYSLGYWRPAEHPEGTARLSAAYGLLAGAMAFVILSRDAILFLISWETMALAAWFAATVEGDSPEVRRSGWVYLVATHVGTLCLFALFSLWHGATGSFALNPALALDPGTVRILFTLGLVGFGVKAGIVPFHVWLPGAHANAPSHVSAVMSGAMLKMGIYGLVRLTCLMPGTEAWMGWTLLGLGAFGGLFGIALSLGQRDLKRALAYSSVENLGLIALGLGLALLGRAEGAPALVVLGLGGAFFHVWNHGLFKSLLFLDAGAVIHGTGTRNLDRLGGLAKPMPLTFLAFIVGSVAISGLPPLNGFAGEWLLYLGSFSVLGQGGSLEAAALGAVALATIGALAVASFVRLASGVFLGQSRSGAGMEAHDPGPLLLLPLGLLGAACLVLGLAPSLVLPLLEEAVRAWSGSLAGPSLAVLAPLGWLTWTGLGLLGLGALILLGSGVMNKVRKAPRIGTWDCGYDRPTARMEYTPSSLGRTLVDLFAFVLRPSTRTQPPVGPFPEAATASSRVADPILDRGIRPLLHGVRRHLPRFRRLQHGQTQAYLLYILITAIVLLVVGGLEAGL